jgi:hypothetical protein
MTVAILRFSINVVDAEELGQYFPRPNSSRIHRNAMAKITVFISGISLLVQRESTDAGLYVLMAYDHHNPPGPKQHKAIVQDLATNNPPDISINGMSIDLRNSLSGGSTRQPMTGTIPTNDICGGRVSLPLLTASVAQPITARVILPLPTAAPKLHSTIDVTSHVGGTTKLHKGMSGVVSFEYTVTGPIQIGTKTFSGNILFGNLQDRPYRNPRKHGKGDPMPHPQLHFGLVKGCAHLFPTLATAEGYDPSAKLLPSTLKQGGLDPVDCTVGSGCGEGEPAC